MFDGQACEADRQGGSFRRRSLQKSTMASSKFMSLASKRCCGVVMSQDNGADKNHYLKIQVLTMISAISSSCRSSVLYYDSPVVDAVL